MARLFFCAEWSQSVALWRLLWLRSFASARTRRRIKDDNKRDVRRNVRVRRGH